MNFWPKYDELPKYFLFRYSFCFYIWVLETIAVGGAHGKSADKIRNDMVDVIFATYATYFDILISKYKK